MALMSNERFSFYGTCGAITALRDPNHRECGEGRGGEERGCAAANNPNRWGRGKVHCAAVPIRYGIRYGTKQNLRQSLAYCVPLPRLCNEAAAQSTNFVHRSVCPKGGLARVGNFTLKRRTSEFNASPDPIQVPINQEQTTRSSYSR
ncbi:hypothetical protein C8J57DRAFT_1240569 [Mycena rebaudengoi]|nr:hypothetical protein C8J57DRAFT_1240569 [Mycena rebaudengoi]